MSACVLYPSAVYEAKTFQVSSLKTREVPRDGLCWWHVIIYHIISMPFEARFYFTSSIFKFDVMRADFTQEEKDVMTNFLNIIMEDDPNELYQERFNSVEKKRNLIQIIKKVFLNIFDIQIILKNTLIEDIFEISNVNEIIYPDWCEDMKVNTTNYGSFTTLRIIEYLMNLLIKSSKLTISFSIYLQNVSSHEYLGIISKKHNEEYNTIIFGFLYDGQHRHFDAVI